jgi:OmpA-OmpF porin, OOP family
MKKILLLIMSINLIAITVHAQSISNLLKAKAGEGARQGAAVAAAGATDKVTDKVLEKLFGGKKNKKSKTDTSDSGAIVVADTGKLPEIGSTSSSSTPSNSTPSNSSSSSSSSSLKTYSKFDFIAGEKILGYDDFGKESIGDFPVRWTTNASGEVMTVDGYTGKWLNVSKQGFYLPEFIKLLPDNFTVEYDVIFISPAKREGANTATLGLQLINNTGKSSFEFTVDRAYFEMDPYMSNVNIASYTKMGEKILSNEFQVAGIDRNKSFTYHVSVWRQKNRLRVYFNETKVVDAPTLLDPEAKYNTIRFATSLNNDGSNWLISNFTFASGLPDTRSKFLNEGKFSTTGILFDINSANIKPSSYGVLKDIASVLKENSDIRVKIVGHTDSDGDDKANLELSKRRADAVKAALINEFSIDQSRLETEGKGEIQPISQYDDAESKAKNRRVEFVKL